MAPPPNDDFANAETINGLSGHVDGTTVDATFDQADHAVFFDLPNVWYTWTAPADGNVTFDTNTGPGSGTPSADTYIVVYLNGATLGDLSTLIAQDDESGTGSLSQLTFTAIGGITYAIEVGTYDTGTFRLTWDLPLPTVPVPRGLVIAPNDPWNEPDPGWVRLDDPDTDWSLRVFQVSIDRGKSNELDTTKTGTLSASFHDPDGILDVTNPDSPFWAAGETMLNPNVQIAYARWDPVAETWHTRFRGFIKELSYDQQTSGFSIVTIEAVDLFEVLADLVMTPGVEGDTPPDGAEGDIYFAGGSTIAARSSFKHVDQRLEDVADAVGIPDEWRDFFSGNVSVQEQFAERYGQALEVMFAAADAEFPGVANIYVSRDGVLRFRGRYSRFFPERPGYGIGQWDVGGAAEAAADADMARLHAFRFRRSKNDIINAALALPQGATDAQIPTQQVEDATSIDKYGRRPWVSEELLTWHGHNDDASETTAAVETKKFATYRVDNYKNPKNRIEQITIRPLRVDHFSGPATWALLCGVELGDVLNVVTTHRGGGGFDEPCYVEGIRETDEPLDGTMRNVTMDIDVSPDSWFASNPFGEVDDGEPS